MRVWGPISLGLLALVSFVGAQRIATRDGIQISFTPDGSLQGWRLYRRRFQGRGGFFVAEPIGKAPSPWRPLRGRTRRVGETLKVDVRALGLNLTATFTARPSALFCEGVLRDTRGIDRAIILAFILPMDAKGWWWWDDLRTGRVIDPKKESRYASVIRYGRRGEHSPYPFCAVSSKDEGVALAIPLDLPVVHRFVYDAVQKQWRLEWDFGLSPVTKTPGTARFRFALYALDEPHWGLRAGAAKFYRLFPESFPLRVKRFGIWMPFSDIAKIVDFEDFHFAYHEGARNAGFNRRHGIYNFRYVEPWSAWFYLPPDVPMTLTPERVFAFPERREQHPDLVAIVKACGVRDEKGRFSFRTLRADWARGFRLYNFLVNPDPDLERQGVPTKAAALDRVLQAVLKDPLMDGLYFDGFGEWVQPNENSRKDHWRFADFPLTFSWSTRKPVLLNAFSVYEYLAYAARKLHAAGKLVMCNGFWVQFPFLAHWVDLGGKEIRWTRQRDDFAFFDLCRLLTYRKPYLPLNNERFETVFTGERAAEYLQWALFYGFLPSCFSPGASMHDNYWETPAFHDRDRHLFRRYLPLIIRLCEVGWEPIPYAETGNRKVFVERFGRWGEGKGVFFTLHNATDRLQTVRLWIDGAKLGIKRRDLQNLTLWVLTDMKTFPFVAGRTKQSPLVLSLTGRLAPRETACLWLVDRDQALSGLADLARRHLTRAVSKGKRRKSPEKLRREMEAITRTEPKGPSGWIRWMARVETLAGMGSGKEKGEGVSADLEEAHRIIGSVVREMVGIIADAILPERVAAGERVRVPVDIRNTGRKTLRDTVLVLQARFKGKPKAFSGVVEKPLGDLSPGALRRELLIVTVPGEAMGQRGKIQIGLQVTLGKGTRVTLPITEGMIRVVAPLGMTVAQFGSEPGILVQLRNETGKAQKVRLSVHSPLPFPDQTVSLKARKTTRIVLKPHRSHKTIGFYSAKVIVKGQGQVLEKWLSLVALPPQTNLLSNGSFEEGEKLPLPGWEFFGIGYRVSKEAIDGARSIVCHSEDRRGVTGARQRVILNQKRPLPLILYGFSKNLAITPSGRDGNYSLYLDAFHTDGTPLWGEIVPFGGAGDMGLKTNNWEWGMRFIIPQKPLREAIVYALFRYRVGTVWFDGVGLTEVPSPSSLVRKARVRGKGKVTALKDGDFQTLWDGQGTNFLTFLFPSEVKVFQVIVWWAGGRRKAKSVRLEVWDGTSWRLVTERPTEMDTAFTVLDFVPQTSSRFRLTLQGSDYGVREVIMREGIRG